MEDIVVNEDFASLEEVAERDGRLEQLTDSIMIL